MKDREPTPHDLETDGWAPYMGVKRITLFSTQQGAAKPL
jgi:hypothetical protein